MRDGSEQGGEYLVKRHELHVARQFMPDLCHALIATEDAGLGGSIQALLRVMFGYRPNIMTVRTVGGVLDGLTENGGQFVLIDDRLFSSSGIDIVSLLGQNNFPAEVVIISNKHRPSDIVEMKNLGAADIIHPGSMNSLNLSKAYIRASIFAQLKERNNQRSDNLAAMVAPLSQRSSASERHLDKMLVHA